MGAVPSLPIRANSRPQEMADYLIGTLVGEKFFPLSSEFWNKLLELPLSLNWSNDAVRQACEAFEQNNYYTRHLAKILMHLAFCLQECMSASASPSVAFTKAINAAYISSTFLKYMIENTKTDSFEELYLFLDESEAVPSAFPKGQNVENFLMHSVLSFISTVDVSPRTYLLHYELHNLMFITMSTQLLSGPSPGARDVHPFIDAAMTQEKTLVALVVRRLLLNYISCHRNPFNNASYSAFSEESQTGVLHRVGSAAANVVLLPLHLFVGSTGETSQRGLLADTSLHLLLILIHYRKCIIIDESVDGSDDSAPSGSLLKENTRFFENPYCKALESARDVDFDRLDIEGNAQSGPLVRLPFASLFDILATCLTEESATLLLYSLAHGNSDFLEYILVRTDLDILVMPMLETLYSAQTRTSNQIYMLLTILLILSQDSTFNASIHKLMIPNVPWFNERHLHYTPLGSLMVIILVRMVKYNLIKLRDVYLHTNCLATLANMAPHVQHLSAYASQRLVSLFDMLSRKYTKLAELQNDKMQIDRGSSFDGDSIPEDTSTELHTYAEFLRIVLELINGILTYALPRNPELVYAIMHRQEVFQPFRSHPRFHELLENIFTVLDFFNSRMDAQETDGQWSVEKVLQVININSRSWRSEGMKMFTQLKFTYEQESHPEEFFIPYVWQLALSNCGLSFDPSKINLFPVDLPRESSYAASEHSN